MKKKKRKEIMKAKKIKLPIAILAMLFTTYTYTQQEPQYTQYMFNMLSVNPAYAGTTESLNMLLLSRIQWVGVEGAPRSHTFAAHSPINKKKIGVGFSVIADNVGPVTNTYINLNYSHRIKLSESHTLSLGLKGGINNYLVDFQDMNLESALSDPSFMSNVNRKFQPNIGAGAYLYHKKYYVGISAPKLFQTDLEDNSNDGSMSELKRHYFLTAGYVYEINSELILKPAILNKIVQGSPPSMDITLQAVYKGKYWLGTTYRIGDAVALLFNVQATRQLMVGYSYDITVSDMNNVTNGSHEIMISYDFKGFSNDKVKSPRYF